MIDPDKVPNQQFFIVSLLLFLICAPLGVAVLWGLKMGLAVLLFLVAFIGFSGAWMSSRDD